MTDPTPEHTPATRPSRNSLMLLLAVLIVVAICIIVIFSRQDKEQGEQPKQEIVQSTQTLPEPEQKETPQIEEQISQEPEVLPEPQPLPEELKQEEPAEPELPTLDDSDIQVKQRISEQFENSTASLFVNDDLIRRSVVFIDNLARGKIIRQHSPVSAPQEKFSVVEGDVLTMDPAGFKRFDPYVAIFTSLSPSQLVTLYREYQPLVDEAYGEIAPAGQSFDDTLTSAIDLLLETPEMKAQIPLLHDSVTYKYAYSEWEGLPAAQKQLLRMGPDNVAKVKSALRAFKAELEKRP